MLIHNQTIEVGQIIQFEVDSQTIKAQVRKELGNIILVKLFSRFTAGYMTYNPGEVKHFNIQEIKNLKTLN